MKLFTKNQQIRPIELQLLISLTKIMFCFNKFTFVLLYKTHCTARLADYTLYKIDPRVKIIPTFNLENLRMSRGFLIHKF